MFQANLPFFFSFFCLSTYYPGISKIVALGHRRGCRSAAEAKYTAVLAPTYSKCCAPARTFERFLITTTMPIELREPDGSITPHVLLAFTQIIALVSPQFPFRRHLFTATLVALFAASRLRPHFSNDPAVVQPFILGWSTFLSTVEKVMFSGEEGPEHHFWRLDRSAHEAKHLGALRPLKLKWAAAMLFNMRGVRWNYEVKNIPPLPKSTKTQYLVKQVAYLLYYGMMADIASQIWFQMFFATGTYDTKYLSLRNGGPLRSFVARLTFSMMPYYMIQIQYVFFAIIAVGLGFSKQEVPVKFILPLSFPDAGRTGHRTLAKYPMSPPYEISGANIGIRRCDGYEVLIFPER
jgi:hypothetical protein